MDGLIEIVLKQEGIVLGVEQNGHVGKGNLRDEEVMGRYGAEMRNKEGLMVMDLAIVNTYFKKDKHRVMYKSGRKSTQVDYVMCRRRDLKEMCDCNVVVMSASQSSTVW